MTIRKTVDLTEQNDAERIARGVLLTPNRIDSQGDWFPPEVIREVAHDYMRRLQDDEAEARLKLMHAVDAGDKISLVENRVLDHPEEIGETQHPAGTWVVGVKAHDETVWRAFAAGVLGGFSVGGDNIEATEQLPDEVPSKVSRSPEYPDGKPVRRIDGTRITEFSPVDRPAVAPAKVEVLKSQTKEHADELEAGGEACREALVQRGHSEEDAALLCRALHKADTKMTVTKISTGDWVTWPRAGGDTRGRIVEIEDEPGEGFEQAISGDVRVEAEEDDPVALYEVWDGFGEDASPREDESGRGDTMHVANRVSRLTDVQDPREREAAADDGLLSRIAAGLGLGADDAEESAEDPVAKVGRTLSSANVTDTMAVHDAAASMLQREGVDPHGDSYRRYSDDPKHGFELSEDYKKMLRKQDIPMPDDALLLYPSEGQAAAVAAEMGIEESAHPHQIEGVGQVFMPGPDMATYREAVVEISQGAHGEGEEQEMSGDNEPAESGAEPEAEQAPVEMGEKLDEILDQLDAQAERVGEIEDRVDKVAAGEASSQQVGGAEESGEEQLDEVQAFKRALGSK